MKRTIISGVVPLLLLLTALVMPVVHLSNNVLVIVGGVLTMILGTSLVFTLDNLRKHPTVKKLYFFIAFFAVFLFIPAFFVSVQGFFFIPIKITTILAAITGGFLLFFFVNEIIKKRLMLKEISFGHFFIVFTALLVIPLQTQQPDYSFNPKISEVSYPKNEGSVIYIDGGHNNIHTLDDRLYSTGNLLKQDGYKVVSYNEKVEIDKLRECKIFIIVNALNEKNVSGWDSPTYPAFSDQEISEIKQWVAEGGSLMLVADHMPFPGAVYNLAKEFGFEFENGHAVKKTNGADMFCRQSNTLHENIITNGKNDSQKIDSIITFSGSAFKIPDDAEQILEFDSLWVTYNPQEAWNYDNIEPIPIKGFSQGAFKSFGKGRVAVFGEAMMFTAQLGLGLSFVKIGMNSPHCPNNYKLLLNTIRWLDTK